MASEDWLPLLSIVFLMIRVVTLGLGFARDRTRLRNIAVALPRLYAAGVYCWIIVYDPDVLAAREAFRIVVAVIFGMEVLIDLIEHIVEKTRKHA